MFGCTRYTRPHNPGRMCQVVRIGKFKSALCKACNKLLCPAGAQRRRRSSGAPSSSSDTEFTADMVGSRMITARSLRAAPVDPIGRVLNCRRRGKHLLVELTGDDTSRTKRLYTQRLPSAKVATDPAQSDQMLYHPPPIARQRAVQSGNLGKSAGSTFHCPYMTKHRCLSPLVKKLSNWKNSRLPLITQLVICVPRQCVITVRGPLQAPYPEGKMSMGIGECPTPLCSLCRAIFILSVFTLILFNLYMKLFSL